jgi:transposase
MANRLKVAMIQAILQLQALGWSQRRIARHLGMHRETVARTIQAAQPAPKPAKAPSGSEGSKPANFPGAPGPAVASAPRVPVLENTTGAAPLSKPAKAPSGSDAGVCGVIDTTGPPPDGDATAEPASAQALEPVSRSACAPFREVIEEKLRAELTAQRIYQDLVSEQNYTGSYYSVRRFVKSLAAHTPLPFRRMECPPGFEAQVDYGTGAPVIGPDGKRRRTHVFRIVLSHSRKGYSEVSFRQTTDDFLSALENSFRHFGGVPQTIVVDNLKAAVTHPDWYDPELNPKLRDFCRHYGTVVLPAKPYLARHKGKIERGVGYVKGNALKGRVFENLSAENEHLARWEATVADTRIHGTTRQQVGQVFDEVERPILLPLPPERFPSFQEAQRIVSRDGHIEVVRAYYSVPPEYLGRTVWVRWDARLVRVFNDRLEQIAVHARHEQGRFSTQAAHIAREKISGLERGAKWLLQKVQLIGPHSSAWSEAMLTARGIEGTRVLLGLIALTKKHSSDVLEQACKTALAHGEFRLRALRRLIVRQPELVQAALPFLDEHPLIRPLEDYAQIVASALSRKEPARQEPARKAPQQSPETRAAAAREGKVRFLRNGRADECQQKDPDGQSRQGLRDIHPPGSGESSSGCSPAGPDSALPDSSSLRPPFPPLPGESGHE